MAINPSNDIIFALKELWKYDPTDKKFKDLTQLLYEITALSSGFEIKNQNQFAERAFKTIGPIFDDDTFDLFDETRGDWEIAIEWMDLNKYS